MAVKPDNDLPIKPPAKPDNTLPTREPVRPNQDLPTREPVEVAKPKTGPEDKATLPTITVTQVQRDQVKLLLKGSGMDTQQQQKFAQALCDILGIPYFGPTN